ncbi:hypothetical protein ACQKPX_18175 [Photobacterium sp. DNB23_23_1]|uniref:Uncharacterized protein n=1 Tax=Photobacterium pectinilyticum TaxID=2906793 RepID=A0ABT1N3I2_9GAMM|nr:hypothetical protein [Photobacterium sp. ZSDE20]MCQ1059102.1 hypothetical protein [Photobacterium sp. ZSDE20]MDD1824155.1 hypothetical protein [Photobacterium sp. ZSDE20]
MLSNRVNELVERALLEGDIKAKVAIEKINQKAMPVIEGLPVIESTPSEEKMLLDIEMQSEQLNQNAIKAARVVASLPFILCMFSFVGHG